MERICLLKVHVSADLYISASKTAVFSVLDCIFFPIVDINISWRTFPSPGQKVSQRTLTQSLNFDVYRLCVRSLHVVNDVWIFFTGLLLKESKFDLTYLIYPGCKQKTVTAGCQKLSGSKKCCLIIHMIVLENAFHNPETLRKTRISSCIDHFNWL